MPRNKLIDASNGLTTTAGVVKNKKLGRWFVYALVDQRGANKIVFYVGITSNWDQRKASHLDNPCVLALIDVKPTMECIRVVDCEETAKRIERHLIRNLPNLVNVVHTPKHPKVRTRELNQRLGGTTLRLKPIVETYQVVRENVP